MSKRRVQLVLLCEDSQHEAFLRRFFVAEGWHPRSLRVEKSPSGRGSAEQWVRLGYPAAVRKLRAAPHVARGLVVMIDEDMRGPGRREAQLEAALKQAGAEPRGASEAIVHAIPARNIETWLAYLDGQDVDETTAYPKLDRKRQCAPMIAELKRMCDEGALRKSAPPSLERACDEYKARL